jgi:dicarboxylate transporter 10
MQTSGSIAGSEAPSIFAIIRHSIAKDGIRSLYTGLSASLLRQMTYSLVRFGSYEEMKRYMAQTGSLSTGKLLLAASAAGGLGGLAGNPAGKFSSKQCFRYAYVRRGYKNAQTLWWSG